MELTLNLVWLCVALGGFLLLGSRLSRRRLKTDQRRDKLQPLVAMSCALIILFFVISMTDDLHNQEIIVEESKCSRVITSSISFSHACHLLAGNSVLFLPTAAAWSLPGLPASKRPVERSETALAMPNLSESLCERAPPASLA